MKMITIFTICLIILIGLFGCDNLKCRPDGKLEKNGGVYGGIKCGGNW